MNKLTVTSGPHIRSPRTTRSVMADVLIALCPALIAAVIIFGLRSLAVLAVCVVTAVACEAVFCLITRRPLTVTDLSAAVTGTLLAMNLPVTIPLWQAALGSFVAIIVVKCLFGGIGCNFANPAIVGRIVLFLSFTSTMAAKTFGFSSLFEVDMLSGATPLTQLNTGKPVTASFGQLLFGTYGGMLGETCALALLLGGVYLLVRRVITWHVPVTFLGTVALMSLICGRGVIPDLLGGGLMLGAIFMATDYVTSPETPWGKVVFGVGCGIVTMFIRVWCAYPEGVSFAILLMNILTPYISELTRMRPLGGSKQ